jgi:hypothetical protein
MFALVNPGELLSNLLLKQTGIGSRLKLNIFALCLIWFSDGRNTN